MRRLILIPMLLAAGTALATPADSVHTRIAGLRELGAAFKAVKDGLGSSELQTILIQQSARQIRNAANQFPGWFPAGSGAEAGVKTSAKPEIWSQPAKFKAMQDAFVAEAGRLQAVAGGNDSEAIHAQFLKLGATCKACHDAFRVPGN